MGNWNNKTKIFDLMPIINEIKDGINYSHAHFKILTKNYNHFVKQMEEPLSSALNRNVI